MLQVIKKDGTHEDYDVRKVVVAVNKSAYRALVSFTKEEEDEICRLVDGKVASLGIDKIPIATMHNVVEGALEQIKPEVAKSYRDYRNYKQDFVRMLDDVYKKSQAIMYIGDKENSNSDSALVSTKRSLIFNQLNKELYQKFFLNNNELQACREGYIYVHDMSARRDTMNCCLFDIAAVLKGGFEMGNLWYNEPKTLDVAFDVIGDIVLKDKYMKLGLGEEAADKAALDDVQETFRQGFQGWEYKFNTVASSRGDYPFISVTAGLAADRFGKMATITMLDVRRGGQGKKSSKKPVLFPKLIFLYDENLHGPGKPLEDVFEAGIRCSAKTMYPDWLSLTGEGYVPSMYKKYGEVISPMGCRAFLSPWYELSLIHI